MKCTHERAKTMRKRKKECLETCVHWQKKTVYILVIAELVLDRSKLVLVTPRFLTIKISKKKRPYMHRSFRFSHRSEAMHFWHTNITSGALCITFAKVYGTLTAFNPFLNQLQKRPLLSRTVFSVCVTVFSQNHYKQTDEKKNPRIIKYKNIDLIIVFIL